MERKANLEVIPILFGIILAASLTAFISTFNFAFADKKLQFEISDCPVQGNSTYERSGPCPDMRSLTKVDNEFDKKPIDSTVPMISESMNPFGP